MYKVIFENEHFIIVDKPSMVLSVSSRLGYEDSRPCLGYMLEKDLKQKLFPVHRLDFEVSGLIIFAKTEKAQIKANFWFKDKTVKKTYEALTTSENNSFMPDHFYEWKSLLAKGKKRAYEAPFGKKSKTHAKLIREYSPGHFVWHLNPITGRSHQLRFELFKHHHPIIGDSLYGSKETFHQGIALRAFKLDFSKCPDRILFDLPEILKIENFGLVD